MDYLWRYFCSLRSSHELGQHRFLHERPSARHHGMLVPVDPLRLSDSRLLRDHSSHPSRFAFLVHRLVRRNFEDELQSEPVDDFMEIWFGAISFELTATGSCFVILSLQFSHHVPKNSLAGQDQHDVVRLPETGR